MVVHDLWSPSVDGGDRPITRVVDDVHPCGRRLQEVLRHLHTAGMPTGAGTIDVPPEKVSALAAHLSAQADLAEEVAGLLGAPAQVGGPVQTALDDLLLCHRTAAHALAGEFRWLGATIAAVVDSWLGLDGSLLAPRGQALPR